jgi:predicted nucleotide-binding protein (sugar kinase/HSP70/actin superfamily)
VLEQLERENKIGIVVLGRPYHNDPGINHEILIEFQKLGYPVFTQDSLPIDDDILEPPLRRRSARGGHRATDGHPRRVEERVQREHSRKVWAAKYTARHPNLVALEVSNFKCGHDAPIYSVVEEIIEHSGTPYYSFKDWTRTAGRSIKIAVETHRLLPQALPRGQAPRRVARARHRARSIHPRGRDSFGPAATERLGHGGRGVSCQLPASKRVS